MYRVLYSLMVIIWIVDILNMNIMINGVNVHEFLDVTIPVNGWAWFLLWVFLPSTSVVVRKEN
jgi:hypothetical protein